MSTEHFDVAANALAQLVAEALRPVIIETIRAEVRDALAAHVSQPAPPRLLTVHGAAERLNVCDETVRRAYRKGELQGVTVLGALRFKPEDIDRALDAKREEEPKPISLRGVERTSEKHVATSNDATYVVNNAQAEEAVGKGDGVRGDPTHARRETGSRRARGGRGAHVIGLPPRCGRRPRREGEEEDGGEEEE